jgi:DNA-binding response OmpR family regulator
MSFKILIAEDELLVLKAMEYKLRSEGYTIITATDGRQAIEKFSSEKPDMLITDIMMPFASGLEILGHIKESRGKAFPVIVLSVAGLENIVTEAFRLGADDFMTKPFSPAELSLRVKRLLFR